MADAPRDSDALGAAISAAVGEVGAPDALRERVGSQARPTPVTRGARRRWALGTGALAVAAVAAALTIAGGDDGPSVADAASASLRPAPAADAPVIDAADPRYITARVGAVRFPNYAYSGRWRAVRQRALRIDGRDAVTVVYARGAERVAYTVVDGDLGVVPSASAVAGDYRLTAVGGAAVVSWRRRGATCVLASHSTSTAAMLALARWRPQPA